MKINKPAFIRDGPSPQWSITDGKEILREGVQDKHDYLVWYHGCWYIQPDEWFLKGKAGGYFCIHATGKYFHNCFLSVRKFIGYWHISILTLNILETNLLALDSCWNECDSKEWSRKATIKIFSDEKQFNEYEKTLQKWFQPQTACKNLVIEKLPY